MGRVFGWALLLIAGAWAAGESSMLFAEQSTSGLSSGELWTLLAGSPFPIPEGSLWRGIVQRLLALPGWSVLVACSLLLLLTSRKRQRPKRKMIFDTLRSSALH